MHPLPANMCILLRVRDSSGDEQLLVLFATAMLDVKLF